MHVSFLEWDNLQANNFYTLINLLFFFRIYSWHWMRYLSDSEQIIVFMFFRWSHLLKKKRQTPPSPLSPAVHKNALCFVCGHLNNRRAPPTDWHWGIKEEGLIPGPLVLITSLILLHRPRSKSKGSLCDIGLWNT